MSYCFSITIINNCLSLQIQASYNQETTDVSATTLGSQIYFYLKKSLVRIIKRFSVKSV